MKNVSSAGWIQLALSAPSETSLLVIGKRARIAAHKITPDGPASALESPASHESSISTPVHCLVNFAQHIDGARATENKRAASGIPPQKSDDQQVNKSFPRARSGFEGVAVVTGVKRAGVVGGNGNRSFSSSMSISFAKALVLF